MIFQEVKIKDIATILNGRAYKQNELLDKGKYKILRVGNFFTSDNWYFSDLELEENKYCNYGDLLYAWSANFGPKIWNEGKTIYHYHIWKIDLKENVDKNYLYYYLKLITESLKNSMHGSVMLHLTKADMENQIIKIPDYINQKKIGEILSSLDKKIELNNQINDNLLKFIKEFYIETFKDEQNKKKIKEVAEFSQGVQVPIEYQSETFDNGLIRFIRIVDLTQGGKDNIRYIESKDRGLVDYDDVFMIRYGSPGILGWNYKGIIANNLFKINPKTDETTKNYLYCYFNDDEIQNYIKQNATSSTMPAINFSLLYDRLIAVPNKEKLIEFDRSIENTRLKLLEIKKENEKLEELRDTLLPKLMNGEIDLDKIEI